MGKFLKRVSLETARAAATGNTAVTPAEQIPTEQTLGRITAGPVFAGFASPHYRASAMDGIAVIAERLVGASTETPIRLTPIEADSVVLEGGVCRPVDTGTAMPEWADAVVRIENTTQSEHGYTVREPVPPGRDVRRIGEDIDSDALLFGSGHQIRPYDIGAMLATGIQTVGVRRKPRVAMLATGTEVVEPGEPPEPGKVIEYNSRVMAGFIQEWGGEAVYNGRVSDDKDALTRAIVSAAEDCDIACVIAGSSAGSKDFTVDVIQEQGELLVHGIDMMPGKPASVAVIRGTPVIGIPGYPVSAVIAYQQLLAPTLAASLGIAAPRPQQIRALVRRKIPSRLGVEEFLRVALAHDGDQLVVSPLARGAGSIATLMRAAAILRIPANSEGIDAGNSAVIDLLGDPAALEDAVVVSGIPNRLSSMLEEALRARMNTARFAHVPASHFDAAVAMERGEVELAILESDGKQTDAEIDRLLTEKLTHPQIFKLEARNTGRGHIVVLTRSLLAREVGKALLSVLEGNSFALELGTLEAYDAGVNLRHLESS